MQQTIMITSISNVLNEGMFDYLNKMVAML